MNDIIAERIQELVKEINNLLEDRDKMNTQIRRISDNIVAKQGAIYELKGLLELEKKD